MHVFTGEVAAVHLVIDIMKLLSAMGFADAMCTTIFIEDRTV
jgi:hypothetical protein